MNNHTFCRHLLTEAYAAAEETDTSVPKHLTALGPSFRGHYFVKGDGIKGVEVSADCAWDAKAKYILSLLPEDADGR